MASISCLSPKSARAARKYGLPLCIKLFKRNRHDGEGASNLAFENKVKWNQVDAAINAGREYVIFSQGNDSVEKCDAALEIVEHAAEAAKVFVAPIPFLHPQQ